MSNKRVSIFKIIVIAIVSGVIAGFAVGIMFYLDKPKPLPKCFQINGPTLRTTTDQPDDSAQEYQVHLMYVLPKDGTDRNLDTNGTIATSVSAWQNWLCNQTNGKTMKLDTYKGVLDVTFVRLDATDNTIATGADLKVKTTGPREGYIVFDLRTHLKALGFKDPHKLYAIYYDGSANFNTCGGTDILHTAAIFLHGRVQMNRDWDCDTNTFTTDFTKPGYLDFAMLHEIIHTQGFVLSCAPHHADYHVLDSNYDLLYSNRGIPDGKPWGGGDELLKIVLDYNHDDYYDANIPNCPDLKDSAFLTGGGKQLPPDW